MKQTKFPRAKPSRLTATEVRTLVRFRDGYRCTECGMTDREHRKKYGKKLDVHRLTPGSRYTVRGCVAICRKCHGSKPKSKLSPSDKRYCYLGIPAALAEVLLACAKQHDLSLSKAATVAIRRFLVSEKFWPPPSARP